MKLLDANLLVYAYVASVEQHSAARAWLDAELSGEEPVGMPWASLMAFLRLVTNPRIYEHPPPVATAWEQVEEWLALDSVWVPEPTEQHAVILAELMPAVTRSSLVPDAHLAAIAIEHGLLLCSSDGDFARFPRLNWANPLASA